MDKRKEKTYNKIITSFKELLIDNNYNDITIQDILDHSHVARSTFYYSFTSKEDMLGSVCEGIFHHVFSKNLTEETTHDFSNSSLYDYKHLITHIFYHINDERLLIHSILKSEAKNYFINKLRDELKPFVKTCIDNNILRKNNLPKMLQINSLLNNFILLIEYYDSINYRESPEELTEFLIILSN